MVTWLLVAYAVFALALITCAASVALWCRDARQRQDAYRVLKLVMTLGTGTGGVAALLLHLAGLGLLR